MNQVVDMLEASAQAACHLITRITILQPMQTRLIQLPCQEPDVVVRELVHTFNLPHVQREARLAGRLPW